MHSVPWCSREGLSVCHAQNCKLSAFVYNLVHYSIPIHSLQPTCSVQLGFSNSCPPCRAANSTSLSLSFVAVVGTRGGACVCEWVCKCVCLFECKCSIEQPTAPAFLSALWLWSAQEGAPVCIKSVLCACVCVFVCVCVCMSARSENDLHVTLD